jgi:aspartate carbamoyltransferase catalytic subunit
VHSLTRTLSHFNVKLNYVAPPELAMPTNIAEELTQKGVKQESFTRLEDAIPQTDVLYVTRIQQERFANQADYLRLKGSYVISPETLKPAKKKMIVMHPLPRVDEISPALDSDPRACYFRQVGYGMQARMALLAMVLGRSTI